MYKKFIGVGFGILLLASPALASAQAYNPAYDPNAAKAQLNALLQQLIIVLTQELQQLLAARGYNTQPLTASCSGLVYNSSTNGVTWSVQASGGSGSYTYGWNLPNVSWVNSSLGGLQSPSVMAQYSSVGTQNASVLVSDGRSNVTAQCAVVLGGNISYQPSITATPTSGSAPLAVSFGVISGSPSDSVNFGDQTSGNNWSIRTDCAGSASYCASTPSLFITHTYATPNIYTATLLDSSARTIASTAVTVTAASAPSKPTGTISSSAGTSLQVGQSTTITLNTQVSSGDVMQYLHIDQSFNGGSLINLNQSSQGVLSDSYTFTPTAPGTYTFYGSAYSNATAPNWYSIPGASIAVTVSASGQHIPTVSLTQTSTSTASGVSFGVSWTSTNATACTVQKQGPAGLVTNPWSTGTSGSGRSTPAVGVNHFWIDCSGPGGSAHADMYHTVTAS